MAHAAPGLAPYASRPEESRGRLVPEAESETRSAFQRDRDRIIHSTAFRRLEYKTQVFVNHEGDHYRTRLTHSIEVAQIARSLARALGLNEDLAEAVALGHDLGHTPFGHAGEEALDAAMAPFGGFSHNDQTFRVLTMLERRYAAFDGLNLTWETLEGTVKHNGPLPAGAAPPTIAAFDRVLPLELGGWPGAEAQVAALADDIAYNNHDIDDGLRAGLFTLEDLADVPLAGPVFALVTRAHPGIEPSRLIHEGVRRMIDRMANDLLAETRQRLAELAPRSVDDIRAAGRPVVGFSEAMRTHDRALKAFLFQRMYRHYRVNRMASKARRVVRDLFGLLVDEPNCLPTDWQAQAEGPRTARTARVVADYVAGMTDRFALDEHTRLFDVHART
ncbi:dGTPase [Stella humosa]|uniref:Deoxyguanosinetriphosphate triphosphohydrolase-like protein n=1 Tax=Stella humosa TaxID=94 RepID=A0A3N1MAV7_9PROT|nr:deoxyguanosinetriphosphate triphosphohydrolase [Stella humosa]ROP99889.1 dGTPase [Stella humosa]BBK30881.1 deoxyguanosinetriphosphate triphosphohydrolase-like protein [Stella humosa]